MTVTGKNSTDRQPRFTVRALWRCAGLDLGDQLIFPVVADLADGTPAQVALLGHGAVHAVEARVPAIHPGTLGRGVRRPPERIAGAGRIPPLRF